MMFLQKCSAVLLMLLAIGIIFPNQAQPPVRLMSVVQAEGLDAEFQCSHPDASVYFWILNGAELTTMEIPPGVTGLGSNMLIIPATVQYNESVVTCEPFNRDELTLDSSNATLTVYTTALTLTNMADTILVSWNSQVFTTELTYCVEVRRTQPVEEMVESVCGLTGPDYSFQFPGHSLCDRFSFTVTPTGPGGMNGTTSQPETGYFTPATGTGGEVTVSQRTGTVDKTIDFEAIVPNCFSSSNTNVSSESSLGPLTITSTAPNVSVRFDAPSDQRIDFTVTLTENDGVDLVYQILGQSTHDVQDMRVSLCEEAECVSVSLEFVEGSLSPGALILVLPVEPEDTTNFIFETIPSSTTGATNISVPAGDYRVLAFDLESNGLPRMPLSEAARSDNITVPAPSEVTMPPTMMVSSISVNIMGDSVEVTCSDPSLNCLVLLHSPSDEDQLTVGVINDQQNRTVSLQVPSSGSDDVYVAVYTWSAGEPIFTGSLALILTLQQPTAMPPATGQVSTEGETTVSGPVVTDALSVDTGLIAGVILVLILILLVVLIVLVIICLRYKRYSQYPKRVLREQDTSILSSTNRYSQLEVGEIGNSPQNGTSEVTETHNIGGPIKSQYAEIGSLQARSAAGPPPPPGYDDVILLGESCQHPDPVPTAAPAPSDEGAAVQVLNHQYSTVIKPAAAGVDTKGVAFYDVVKKENMEPKYQTVDDAKRTTKSPVVEDGAAPELPPRKEEDTEPPPIPPPYDPAIDKSMEMLDTVGLEASGDQPDGAVKKKYVELDCDDPSALPSTDTTAKSGKSQYAEVVHEKTSTAPKDPSKVVYAEIKPEIDPVEEEVSKEHQYALIDHKSKGSKPPAADPKRVVYSQVDPGKLKPVDPAAQASPAAPQAPLPPSMDTLYPLLGELSGRWEDLAKALGVDEDRIDDIFTNNENDKLRLHGMLEYYLANVHFRHSWEEVVQALTKMEEHGIADKISREKLLQGHKSGQSQFTSLV